MTEKVAGRKYKAGHATLKRPRQGRGAVCDKSAANSKAK